VPKKSEVEIYVKFYHSDSLIIFQTFESPMEFIYKYESKLVENLIFLTILFIIVLYTLVLYFHIRKIYFIYYAAYLFSLIIAFSTYTVVWPIFVSFEPSFSFYSFFTVLVYCFSLLFIINFLNFCKVFPKFKKFIYLLFLCYGIYALLILVGIQKDILSSFMRFNLILNVLSILLILLISIKKVKYAKHLLIGWSGYTFAVIVNNLLHFGIVPYNFFTTNAFEFGTVFENFTFSYVLGLQLKMMNDERIKLLEEKHQKENFFHAQSKFALAGQVLFQIEHEWRRPLSYIPAITSTLQSKLFTNQKIDNTELNNKLIQIDEAVKNIQTTMDEFKKFYTPDKIKKNIKLDHVIVDTIEYFKKVSMTKDIIIDTNLKDVEIESFEGDWKHIVLNLLQNSIDHCNSKEQIKIFIEVFNQNNKLEFNYYDNCGGTNNTEIIFEPFYSSKTNKGIGLFMVKYIVTDRLNGEITAINYKEGLKTTIKTLIFLYREIIVNSFYYTNLEY
jgi:signal transduction histidine kinase